MPVMNPQIARLLAMQGQGPQLPDVSGVNPADVTLTPSTQASLDADTARIETLKRIMSMLPQNQNMEAAHGNSMDAMMGQADARINSKPWQPQLNDISGMPDPSIVRGMMVAPDAPQGDWEAGLMANRMKNLGTDNMVSSLGKIAQSDTLEDATARQNATSSYWNSTGGQARAQAADAEQARRQGIMDAKNPNVWRAEALQRQQILNKMLQGGGGNGIGQALAYQAAGLDPRLGAMNQENALKERELGLQEKFIDSKIGTGGEQPGLATARPDVPPQLQPVLTKGGWANLTPEEQKQLALGTFARHGNWAYKAIKDFESLGITPEQVSAALGGIIPELDHGHPDPIESINKMMFGQQEQDARKRLGSIQADTAPAGGAGEFFGGIGEMYLNPFGVFGKR